MILGLVLALLGAAACLVSPWLGCTLLGLVCLRLVLHLGLDAKPLMVAAAPLQRSCLAMPGYLAAAGAAVLAVLQLGRGRKRLDWPARLVVCFVAYTLLSLYFRAAVEQGRYFFPNPLQTAGPTFYKFILHAMAMYVVLALGLSTRRDVRRVVGTYLLLTTAFSTLAIYQHVIGDNAFLRAYWDGKEPLSRLKPDFSRATALFMDPNHLGNFLVVGVLLALGDAARVRGLRRLTRLGVVVLGGIAVFFSHSVSSWVGLVTSLLVFTTLRRGWLHAGIAGSLVLLLGLLTGASTQLLPDLDADTVSKLSSLAAGDSSLDGPFGIRVALAGVATRMFWMSPLVGLGYGAFQAHLATDEVAMQLTRNITYSHNSYLLVLAELGILGMVLLLGILAAHARVLLRLARDPDPEYRALGAALCAGLLACLIFEATYGSLLYNGTLWTVMGLGLGIRSRRSHEA